MYTKHTLNRMHQSFKNINVSCKLHVLQVQLGVLNKAEDKEGMPDIVEHQHTYVPGHANDKPVRTVVAGDLMTCERTSAAMEDVRNAQTKSGRREGMIPVIADFHLLGNFYQVRHFIFTITTGSF